MNDTLGSKDDVRTYLTLCLEEFLQGINYQSLQAGGKVRKVTVLKALANHIRRKLLKLAQE